MNQCTYIGITPAKYWNYAQPTQPHTVKLPIKTIIDYSCSALGVNTEKIIGLCRVREYTEARFIAMNIVKVNYPHLTLKQIGSFFSNRHHTTIMYALETYSDLYDTNKDFRRKADIVSKYLKSC